jgi:hypothetical protein
MKYFIQRGIQEYGPYTLAELQRYVATGNILLTDLTRSEGLNEWVPVSQVMGNIPIPVPAPAAPAGTVYGSGTVYGGTTSYGAVTTPAVTAGPVPPDIPWGLVLVFGIVTCTLFYWAWLIVEAAYVRKVKPESKGLLLVIISMASYFFGGFMRGFITAMNHDIPNPLYRLFSLAGFVLLIVSAFTLRSDLEDYYNSVEPINLQLSGVMTFFFAVFYFQHHFSRISKWKKTGVLEPQG